MSANKDQEDLKAAQAAMETLFAGAAAGQNAPASPPDDPPPNPGAQSSTTSPDGGEGADMAARPDPPDIARILQDALAQGLAPVADLAAELQGLRAELAQVQAATAPRPDPRRQLMVQLLDTADSLQQMFQREKERREADEALEARVMELVGLGAAPDPDPSPTGNPTHDFIDAPPPGKKEYTDVELINYYRKHRKMPDDWHAYSGQPEAIKNKVLQIRRGVDDGGFEEWSNDQIVAHARKNDGAMPHAVFITEQQKAQLKPLLDELAQPRRTKRVHWKTPRQ